METLKIEVTDRKTSESSLRRGYTRFKFELSQTPPFEWARIFKTTAVQLEFGSQTRNITVESGWLVIDCENLVEILQYNLDRGRAQVGRANDLYKDFLIEKVRQENAVAEERQKQQRAAEDTLRGVK